MRRDRVNQPIQVVAAVIVSGNMILACRRSPMKSAGGKWEFPGGKVEPHESPETALIREIREELGIVIKLGERIARSDTRVGDFSIDLASYWASVAGPNPTSSTDHDELRWIAIPDLHQLDWAAPDLPTVNALVDAGST